MGGEVPINNNNNNNINPNNNQDVGIPTANEFQRTINGYYDDFTTNRGNRVEAGTLAENLINYFNDIKQNMAHEIQTYIDDYNQRIQISLTDINRIRQLIYLTVYYHLIINILLTDDVLGPGIDDDAIRSTFANFYQEQVAQIHHRELVFPSNIDDIIAISQNNNYSYGSQLDGLNNIRRASIDRENAEDYYNGNREHYDRINRQEIRNPHYNSSNQESQSNNNNNFRRSPEIDDLTYNDFVAAVRAERPPSTIQPRPFSPEQEPEPEPIPALPAAAAARAVAQAPVPAAAAREAAFQIIQYSQAEKNNRMQLFNIKHSNYGSIINEYYREFKLKLYQGYIDACKLLHGHDNDMVNDLNNKLILNYKEIDRFRLDMTNDQLQNPEFCYNSIVNSLSSNSNKIPNIVVSGSIDAGGLFRQFSISVGSYIKTKFMISTIKPTQKGGAAAAATANNTQQADKCSVLDLSPKDFNLQLDISTDDLDKLANVLKYYAFTVSHHSRPTSLGINFSAFALMVLFDETRGDQPSIIQRIENILTKLREKRTKTIKNNKNNKKDKKIVNDYFKLNTSETTFTPLYTRKEDQYKELDDEIRYLLGVLYVIEELYDPAGFNASFQSKFPPKFQSISNKKNSNDGSKIDLDIHREFFRLLSSLTHSDNDTKDKMDIYNNSEKPIWDDVIEILLPKIQKLNSLGIRFREGKTIPRDIDLFSLGRCISEVDEVITADKLRSIITYINTQNIDRGFVSLIQDVIETFLTTSGPQKLLKFIKFITGSISTPRQIIIDFKNYETPQSPFVAHTCSMTLEVNTLAHSIRSKDEKEDYLKFLNDAIEIEDFTMLGGSLHRRLSKKHHKQKRSKKHNKNKQSYKLSHKSSKHKNKNNYKKRTEIRSRRY